MVVDNPVPEFTVIKLNSQGKELIRYTGMLSEYLSNGIKLHAYWTLPTRDTGYTRFETGDLFIEYYYTDRWFNVFAIYTSNGHHKGWYCNIAEPASITTCQVEQIDLFLDVWINTTGTYTILDEDEFIAASYLSTQQRAGAQRGLDALLQLLAARQEVFASLAHG